MPLKRTVEKARKDRREGKSPSTQAGEFVREEIDKIRHGEHGARSTKQVAKACGAGSVCGRCRHTVRTMIEATAPDPPSSKPDRLHRRWGRT